MSVIKKRPSMIQYAGKVPKDDRKVALQAAEGYIGYEFRYFFQRIKDDEEVVWKAIQSDADFMFRAVRIHPAFFFSLRRVIYGTIVK